MGYTTTFRGQFDLDKPLTEAHAEYLNKFSETRRMKRAAEGARILPDPVRLAVGLDVGPEGAYFVGGGGDFGQDRDASILDYNNPPKDQPGLWCQWVPTADLRGLEWNQAEKFYDYTEWLQYLIDNFLKPWGYTVTGSVDWRGEDFDDCGTLTVADGVVTATAKH